MSADNPRPLPPSAWACLASAMLRERPRVPFSVCGVAVGSVALDQIEPLRGFDDLLVLDSRAVQLRATAAAAATEALGRINTALRAQGLLPGWRNETYAVVDPSGLQVLATMERAASRFWGTLTFGAHCNGFVADRHGAPSHLWIARRALSKATDPGLLDNLVGGGVPAGHSAWQTLVREGFEEAGLDAGTMQHATAGRVVATRRDVAEGLQHEHLHVFDLALPAGVTPQNRDGEVAGFRCVPLDEALALAAGSPMTVDAALATLEFALRRGLLKDAAGTLAGSFSRLIV